MVTKSVIRKEENRTVTVNQVSLFLHSLPDSETLTTNSK
jgi:hypothetical protein